MACYTLILTIFHFALLFVLVATMVNHDHIGHMTDAQILEKMITPDKYDFRMLPQGDVHTLDDSTKLILSLTQVHPTFAAKTIVNVSILILSLTSPDESSVTYEIGFIMSQKWYDPRLKFEMPPELSHKLYLNGFRYSERIWTPDIYFIKLGEFRQSTDPFEPAHIALKVFPNGTVFYSTRRNMVINCQGNLRIFPFDSPKCFFGIESTPLKVISSVLWADPIVFHEKDQLELRWDLHAPIGPSESLKTINAYMLRNETNRCNRRHTWRREFSCLSVLLVFSRDQWFYFSTVFVPGMVLVTSSFISFWLDVNAVPARVMIGVTTMLNFCTTTNSFRSKLPVVSNLDAMNLWDFVCMFFIYASMIEFIIVNYIHRNASRREQTRPSVSRQSISSQSESASFRRKSLFRRNTNTKNELAIPRTSTSDKANQESGQSLICKTPLFTNEGISVCSADHGHISGNSCHHHEVRLSSPQTEQSNRVITDESGVQPDEGISLLQMKNVFIDWMRKPYLLTGEGMGSGSHLARFIDHVSKTVFTLLYGLFSFFYFLTYGFIKPAQLDDWIEKEFEAAD